MPAATETIARPSRQVIADDELFLVRVFDAPVALVFRLWSNPELRARWWGPKGFTCTHLEQDFRPGGAWRACISSPTHGESWQRGVFREIERDRRIVFTFAWEGGPSAAIETLVTITFAEELGTTIQ